VTAQTTSPSVRFGVPTRRYEGVVDPAAALAFANATFDRTPAYEAGTAVPPLYTAVLVLPSLLENRVASIDDDALVPTDGSAGHISSVHAEHDVSLHQPLHAGQRVTWDCSLLSMHQTPAGALSTQQLVVRDLDGRPLVDHRWSTMSIKATALVTGGPRPADHTFPEEARSRPLGQETFFIPLDQGKIYADASGDNVGHALSDEIAQAEGFPSRILQGMCFFATATGSVVRIAGGVEPNRLRRVAARFTAPVLQGYDLTVECYDAGALDDGTSVVAFEARQGDRLCIRHGRAEFSGLV
jgi:acyl dehydratase